MFSFLLCSVRAVWLGSESGEERVRVVRESEETRRDETRLVSKQRKAELQKMEAEMRRFGRGEVLRLD